MKKKTWGFLGLTKEKVREGKDCQGNSRGEERNENLVQGNLVSKHGGGKICGHRASLSIRKGGSRKGTHFKKNVCRLPSLNRGKNDDRVTRGVF